MGHGGFEATDVAEIVVRRVLGYHWKRFGLGKGLDPARNGRLAHKKYLPLCSTFSTKASRSSTVGSLTELSFFGDQEAEL